MRSAATASNTMGSVSANENKAKHQYDRANETTAMPAAAVTHSFGDTKHFAENDDGDDND